MTAPRLAAHRGGAALWPENSLCAFRNALALGSHLVELDVHLAADGHPAVIHDATLDRTTDATGAVAALPASALREVRLRRADGAITGERLPMLEDVLTLVAPTRAGVLVEVKGPQRHDVAWERIGSTVRAVSGERYPGIEARVLEAVTRAGMAARATIMAFNPAVIARVRSLAPAMRTTLLVSAAAITLSGSRPEDAVEWTVAAGAPEAGMQYTLVDEAVMQAARRRGIAVGAWTVNDEPAMRRLCELGVDVLTTDRPDLALGVLAERA